MRPLPFALALLLSTKTLSAQADVSAKMARAYWREAAQALQHGDTAGALAALDSAERIWPPQQAYPVARFQMAVAAARLPDALAAARHVVALGLSIPISARADSLLARDVTWRPVADALAEAGRPMVRSRVLYTLADTLFHPEGVAYDPASQRWFISSIRERRIVVIDRRGVVGAFAPVRPEVLDAAFGMVIDAQRGWLWVATSGVAEEAGYTTDADGRSSLVAFDLRNGTMRARVALPPDEAGHALGDVAIAANGELFASDTRAGAVYRVPAGPVGSTAVLLAKDPLLRSPQGMVPTPDGKALIVADYSHGLLRIDLASGGLTPVPLATPGTLLGIDGLVAGPGGGLVAVQNGVAPTRVVALTLDAAWTEVLQLEVIDRPMTGGEATLGVMVGRRFVYVAGSTWDNYQDGHPRSDVAWPPPTLRALDLRR